jgi:hypothetical protein
MTRKKVMILVVCLACIAIFAASLADERILAAPAEPAEELAIPWWTVDGGGGTSLGGPYVLNGTLGQPDAGNIAGGVYSIKSGFWGGSIDYITNLPLIVR